MAETTTIVVVPIEGERGAGRFAIIDPEDAPAILKHKWYLDKDGYAWANVRMEDGRLWRVGMQRLINETPPGFLTDHVNRLPLDNRRCNLRTTSNSQNQGNRRKAKPVSRFTGIALDRGRWKARIQVDGKRRALGRFGTQEEAARAYDKAAREAYGDYAHINLPGA
jgi:hypothetical protein